MFIQTQDTPNPATLKFIPGCPVTRRENQDFASPQAAGRSALASVLFAIPGVRRVFLGADFISVTKDASVTWESLKPDILHTIMEYFLSATHKEEKSEQDASEPVENSAIEDSEAVAEIKEILNGRVRLAVAADGGDIVFDRFEDGIVYVHLRGACSGCPSATATLKSGIENMLRHYVPEVLEVRAVPEEPHPTL